jgi:arylsulfatase
VDDGYELPFRFTGKIDKLTFKLGPSQLAEQDQKKAQVAIAKASD